MSSQAVLNLRYLRQMFLKFHLILWVIKKNVPLQRQALAQQVAYLGFQIHRCKTARGFALGMQTNEFIFTEIKNDRSQVFSTNE